MLFWPNSEIWTFENTFMIVWPSAMLLGALNINLSGISFRNKAILNSLLATVGTFSWANGMLLWLFALPLPGAFLLLRGFPYAAAKKEAWWYLFYVAACIACMGFYFHDYSHGPLVWDLPLMLHYLFAWIGGFFGNLQQAEFIGICVSATYALLAGIYLRIACKQREFADGYPWLMMGLFSIASGLLTSLGRAKYGAEQALSPRYTAVSVYLYIAILGLFCVLWRHVRSECFTRASYFTGFAAGAVVCLLIPLGIKGYARGYQFMGETQALRKTVLAAWQWSKVIPHNVGLGLP